MEVDELNKILGDGAPPQPTFLSELNKDKDMDTVQEKFYKCRHCGQEGFKNLPELMRHGRVCPNKPAKKEAISENNKSDIMTEETETLLEPASPVEIEEAKPKTRKKEKEIAEIPSDYDRLASILRSFGVPNWAGVIEGMKLHSIDDINALKDLLRNVATPQGKAEAVVRMWSELQGLTDKSMSIALKTPEKPVGTTDALSLMAKLRDEDIQDSIVESYKEKLKGKKLENELAAKRLSGELMESKNPETDRLKLELEILKLHLQSQPKNDGQSEMLKQEILELRRKFDEETKMNQIREEARKERELFIEAMKEKDKKIEEAINTVKTTSAPKTEDILRTQMVEMQRQFNEQIAKLNNDFLTARREEAFKLEMEKLKEENKRVKEDSEGQIGQLAGSMKEFAQNMTHAFEMSVKDREHERKEDELKKKLNDLEHNKALTNEQYVFEKTTKVAEEVGKAVSGALGSFGEALKPSVQKSAEVSSAYDRARMALELKAQGFPADKIPEILNSQQKRAVPSAEQEYYNIQKQTEQLQRQKSDNIISPETISEPSQEPVKFNTDKE